MPKQPTPVDTTGYQKRSDELLKKYDNLEFVRRINPTNGGVKPFDFGNGQTGTHKMAYAQADGGNYAYPTLVNIDGTLKQFDGKTAMDYAFKNKQAIPLGEDTKFAEYFTTAGYKKAMGKDVFQRALIDYSKTTKIKTN